MVAAGIVVLALVAGGAPEPERRPELVLRQAPVFRHVAAGDAGSTPGEVRAFRRLLAAHDGAVQFRSLVEDATPAGRLYALCGLFFLDPAAFDEALLRLSRSEAPVAQQRGCIVHESTLAAAVAPAEGAPRTSHSGDFREWLRHGFLNRAEDVAGGSTCHRLRYGSTVPTEWLEDPSKAPQDGPGLD